MSTHASSSEPALPGDGSAIQRALSPREILEAAIVDEVEAMGYDLVTVEWGGAPRHRLVRAYIDRLPGSVEALETEGAQVTEGQGSEAAEAPGDGPVERPGIRLDEIIKLSPIISAALDAAENDPSPKFESLRRLLQAGYTLECSSPGIERPLAKRAHFAAFVGRRITVRTHESLIPGKKQKTFHGVIVSCELDGAPADDAYSGTLVIDEADGAGRYEIPLPAIKRAHLVYEEQS